MAEETKKAPVAVQEKVQEQPKKHFESVYTIPELVSASAAEFNTTSIVVKAALKKAGKAAYTLREAKQIIEKMKKKEVKA